MKGTMKSYFPTSIMKAEPLSFCPRPVLIALGTATLGLLATAPLGGLRLIFSPFDGFSGSLAQPVPYSGWFLFGALIGSASLLFGVSLGKTNGGSQVLSNGVLAASLFVLMIAPGLAIICVPFTLGLFYFSF